MNTIEIMLDASKDALSGWRYIRDVHGDLYGVGWERVEEKLSKAIALGEADLLEAIALERLTAERDDVQIRYEHAAEQITLSDARVAALEKRSRSLKAERDALKSTAEQMYKRGWINAARWADTQQFKERNMTDFEKWFDETCPDDAAAVKMHDHGSLDYLNAMMAIRKKRWSEQAYQAGRDSMKAEAVKMCEGQETLRLIARLIKELA